MIINKSLGTGRGEAGVIYTKLGGIYILTVTTEFLVPILIKA